MAIYLGENKVDGGGSSGTSTPAVNEVVEFNNNAKVNSTNMSSQEVEDFIDGLNVSGGGVPTTESWVDLASYTSNYYTFPSDGYVFTYNASNNSSYLSVFGDNGDDGTSTIAIGAQNSRHSLFVQKGMKCKVTGSFSAVRFTPMVRR